MSSFLNEALKGAKADIDSAGSELAPRLARTARVARILGAELAAIVALAPYGMYSMSIFKRLPALNPPPAAATPADAAAAAASLQQQLRRLPLGRDGVAVARQVRYGPAPRNYMDIYVPIGQPAPAASAAATADAAGAAPASAASAGANATAGSGSAAAAAQQLRPVVFFVHGGVWASGETWQYAPMATRLAQQGLIVVVPTYTLYPEALTGTMVEEVSAALSWTLDNVVAYGGDPARVSAVGHSAGGHLVAWALLRRAAAAAAAAAAASAPPAVQLLQAGTPAAAAAAVPAQAQAQGSGKAAVGSEDGVAQRPPQRRAPAKEEPQGYYADHPAGDGVEAGAYLLGGAAPSLPGALHALRTLADSQLHPRPGVDDVEPSYDDGDGSSSSLSAAGRSSRGAAATAAAAAAAPHGREADVRMPALFVGMSAVYDIAKHYEFEKARHVHELSMMKRAVGGPAGFAAASPSVILAAAAAEAGVSGGGTGSARPRGEAGVGRRYQKQPPLHHDQHAGNGSSPPEPQQQQGHQQHSGRPQEFFHSFELLGDAIPARAGLPTASALYAPPAHASGAGAASAAAADGAVQPALLPAEAEGGQPRFSLAAAAWLPPCVVMGSCTDHMVPWHEGAELVARLDSCGVPVRHLLYNHVGHGDFVMAWKPLDVRRQQLPAAAAAGPSGSGSGTSGSAGSGSGLQQQQPLASDWDSLLPCGRDLLMLVTGRVRPVAGLEGAGAAAAAGGPSGSWGGDGSSSLVGHGQGQGQPVLDSMTARARL